MGSCREIRPTGAFSGAGLPPVEVPRLSLWAVGDFGETSFSGEQPKQLVRRHRRATKYMLDFTRAVPKYKTALQPEFQPLKYPTPKLTTRASQ